MKKLKKFIKKKSNIELIFSGRTFYRIWNTLKGTIFLSGVQGRPGLFKGIQGRFNGLTRPEVKLNLEKYLINEEKYLLLESQNLFQKWKMSFMNLSDPGKIFWSYMLVTDDGDEMLVTDCHQYS